MAYAKEVHPKDQFDFVKITPMQFVPYDEAHAHSHPHVGFWEAVGDSECYEGE